MNSTAESCCPWAPQKNNHLGNASWVACGHGILNLVVHSPVVLSSGPVLSLSSTASGPGLEGRNMTARGKRVRERHPQVGSPKSMFALKGRPNLVRAWLSLYNYHAERRLPAQISFFIFILSFLIWRRRQPCCGFCDRYGDSHLRPAPQGRNRCSHQATPNLSSGGAIPSAPLVPG
jgi:hypothetical protein